jgi:hypothetical protein
MKRKTLDQANAEKGYFDAAKFDSFSDADIERMIAEDPDQAPRLRRCARCSTSATSAASSGSADSSSPGSCVCRSRPFATGSRAQTGPIPRCKPSCGFSTAFRNRRCSPSTKPQTRLDQGRRTINRRWRRRGRRKALFEKFRREGGGHRFGLLRRGIEAAGEHFDALDLFGERGLKREGWPSDPKRP